MFTYVKASLLAENVLIKYASAAGTSASTCPAEWILKDSRVTIWIETLTLHAIASYRDTTCQDYR